MAQVAGLVDFRGQGAPHDVGTFLVPANIVVYQATFGGAAYVCAARQAERGWALIAYLPLTGANATTAINTALAALTAGRTWKETIIVSGNFTGLGVIIVYSYTILVIQGSWACQNNLNTHWILNSDTVGGNTFIDICSGKLDGNQANQTADVNVIHFKTVTNCWFYRLHIICSKRVTVTSVPGADYGGCGIQGITASQCIVYSCRIEQMMKDGVQFETSSIENIVCHCTFYTTVSFTTETCAIQLCINNSGYSIAAYNTINMANLANTDCLKLHGANYNILIGNVCRNGKLAGIMIYCQDGDTSNNIISKNNIVGAGGAGPGINMRGQAGTQHPRNVFEGNNISGHLVGIFIDSNPDSSHSGVDDTYILNNTYKGTNAANENAVKIENSHRVVVKGNRSYNCGTSTSSTAAFLLLGESDYTELNGNYCYYSVFTFRQAVLNAIYPNFTSWTDNFSLHTVSTNGCVFNGGSYHICARNRVIGIGAITVFGVTLDENADYVWIFNNMWFANTGTVTGVNHLVAGSNIYVYSNKGWVTENTVLGPQFAVDAVALVTFNIPHGLSVTPNKQDCSLTLLQDTVVTDFNTSLIMVTGTDATNVACAVYVLIASLTGGAKARLGLTVTTGLPNKAGGFIP